MVSANTPDAEDRDSTCRDTLSTDELIREVYDELRALAEQCFIDQPADHTLQPTALVHEAYLRLAKQTEPGTTRAHFCTLAARVMRQVLIDHARRRIAEKRGGTWCRVTLSDVPTAVESAEARMAAEPRPDGPRDDEHGTDADRAGAGRTADLDVLALNDALDRLAELNERQCSIVELRFLGGLSVEDTAEALEISPRTVKLDWRMARAWLLGELERQRHRRQEET